jgi:hypothetical protein
VVEKEGRSRQMSFSTMSGDRANSSATLGDAAHDTVFISAMKDMAQKPTRTWSKLLTKHEEVYQSQVKKLAAISVNADSFCSGPLGFYMVCT